MFSEKIVNLNILRRSFIQILSTFKKNHEKIRFFNVIYGSKYSLGQLLLKHAKEDKTQKTFERKKNVYGAHFMHDAVGTGAAATEKFWQPYALHITS